MDAVGVDHIGRQQNAFGFLRLLFASLVIVSHTPELTDGNRGREVLTNIFGTISFGELAVDAFFIVSGYLITGSYLKRPAPLPYLKRRIARLYPAFVAASILCVTVFAPLAGGGTGLAQASTWVESFIRLAILEPPAVAGSFSGTHYPVLNSALWTIAYEFRCYVLILCLGVVGAFRKPWIIVGLAIGLLTLYQIIPSAVWEQIGAPGGLLLGAPGPMLRLTGVYLSGSVFYLYRHNIRYSNLGVAGAVLILVAGMYVPCLAEPAVATFGAYLILGFAKVNNGIFCRINDHDDISYGVYLYAWPIEKLMIWYSPTSSLLALGLSTLALACVCGWVSWKIIEKPIMNLVQ